MVSFYKSGEARMFTIDEAREEVLASVEKLRKRGIPVKVGPEETYKDIPGKLPTDKWFFAEFKVKDEATWREIAKEERLLRSKEIHFHCCYEVGTMTRAWAVDAWFDVGN